MEKSVYTTAEFASEMHISKPTAYALLHSAGGPPVIRVGRCLRIPADGFKAWLAASSERPEA